MDQTEAVMHFFTSAPVTVLDVWLALSRRYIILTLANKRGEQMEIRILPSEFTSLAPPIWLLATLAAKRGKMEPE